MAQLPSKLLSNQANWEPLSSLLSQAASNPLISLFDRSRCSMNRPAWSGASLRNRGPILDQLLKLKLPAACKHALEIGTGRGAHLALNAPAFPGLIWHPTDVNIAGVEPLALAAPNVREPVVLDASADYAVWPGSVLKEAGGFGLLLCVNVVHIAPWEVTSGLFTGARKVVAKGGWVVLYGPYFEESVKVSEGNVNFDKVLRTRDRRWGVRRLKDVRIVAEREGFEMKVRTDMPANNLFVGFRRVGS